MKNLVKKTTFVIGVGILLLFAVATSGQTKDPRLAVPGRSCGDLQELSATLNAYQEGPVFRGQAVRLLNGKSVIVNVLLLSNTETGTWTYAELYPNNVACLIDTGESGRVINSTLIKL